MRSTPRAGGAGDAEDGAGHRAGTIAGRRAKASSVLQPRDDRERHDDQQHRHRPTARRGPGTSISTTIAVIWKPVLALPSELTCRTTPWRPACQRSSATPASRSADHERDPQRQAVDHDQRGERGADEQLVGERIGDPPEGRDHVARAGDVPVGRVGERRDAEHRGGGGDRARLLAEQQHEQQRHERDPAQRQDVGQVERHEPSTTRVRARASVRRSRAAAVAVARLRSIRHPVSTRAEVDGREADHEAGDVVDDVVPAEVDRRREGQRRGRPTCRSASRAGRAAGGRSARRRTRSRCAARRTPRCSAARRCRPGRPRTSVRSSISACWSDAVPVSGRRGEQVRLGEGRSHRRAARSSSAPRSPS